MSTASADVAEPQVHNNDNLGKQAPLTPGRECSQCVVRPYKYRCPACDTRTCSLACSKAHKQGTGCTGKRSRTDLVTMSEFTERHLLSDYKFLEEAARLNDVAQRSEVPRPARQLPHGLQMFVDEARRRGIKYEILPPGMQRRKLNSSRFDKRSRTVFWHVHWCFPAAGESVHDQRVSEQTPLRQVLEQHVSLTPGNSVRRHALRAYVEAGLHNLEIFMKKEHCPANKPEYYRIDAERFLRQELSGKAVIEFPILTVLLPGEDRNYSLTCDGIAEKAEHPLN